MNDSATGKPHERNGRMPAANERILVTGGAGFIGSHLVDAFLAAGHDVLVVDNFSTGKKENLPGHVRWYDADVTDKHALLAIVKRESPTIVVHAAAQINVRSSFHDPQRDAEINIKGAINVLECCKDAGVKRALYLSSGGAVYGIPNRLPCTEQAPGAPVNPYGVSKYTAELYFSLYHHLYQIEYGILRLSNVYGPRQDPHGEAGVVSIFADAVLHDRQPVVFGDGTQTRDFVYVADVAAAAVLAVRRLSMSFPKPFDERIFNISSGEAISVNDALAAIQHAAGNRANHALATVPSVPAKHQAAVSGEVKHMVLDSSLAKKALGWMPSVGFEEGIEKTVEWMR